MKPIKFDGANVVYGANQPEYMPLPAHKDEHGCVTTCWKLSPEELKRVQETGVIWCSMLTFNQPLQPIVLATEIVINPNAEPCDISDETIRDLTE